MKVNIYIYYTVDATELKSTQPTAGLSDGRVNDRQSELEEMLTLWDHSK